MSKAKQVSSRTTVTARPRTVVAKLIARYQVLDKAGFDLSENHDESEICNTIGHEMSDLEAPIILADVECLADIAAKWKFISGPLDLLDQDNGLLGNLIDAILQRDADKVGASIPELEARGIIASKRLAGPAEREAAATERRCQNAIAYLSTVDEDGCTAEERAVR